MGNNAKPNDYLLRLARRSHSVTASLQDRQILALVLGAVLAGAALAIRLFLGDTLSGFPFLTFFFAVAVSSFYFGWRAGAVCAIIGGILSWFFLIQTDKTIVVTASSAVIAMLFYTFTTGLFVLLTAAMQSSFGAFETLTNDLEERVKIRTAELEQSNISLKAEITRGNEAESQVRQLQKMEALGKLTGGMAHDFNNMLAVIMASLNLLQRRMARGEGNTDELITAASDSARRAAALTERLLAFSRQQPLAPSVLDANRLVSSMSDILARTLGDEIMVETVLGAGLWKTKADPHQLESAILNLAVNARDAMPGGGKLTVETANAHIDDAYARENEIQAGQYVLVAVTDTGTGMNEATLARVFDPFFTTKPTGQGTGLGLSQVFGFVRQSSGHIKIYSETGVGTTAKVYLPRSNESEAAAPRRTTAEAPPEGSPDIVILVVEDDDRVRKLSVEALAELGYTVIEASSGAKALAIIDAGQQINLLFTDVVMPQMTGKELADAALKKLPDFASCSPPDTPATPSFITACSMRAFICSRSLSRSTRSPER